MQIETANDYEPLAAIVADRAPRARFLDEITAHAGADYHSVWLDETDTTVWHAWSEPGEDLWTLDHEPAYEALAWITETLTLALDSLASPEEAENYLDQAGREEDDLDALNELEAVRLAALRTGSANPVVIDRRIRSEMDAHREQIRLLARLRASNLQQAFGTERGAPAAAARALGVTPEAARRAISAADEFDNRVREAAAQARKERQELEAQG